MTSAPNAKDKMNVPRHALKETLNAQRTEDYRKGTAALAGGVIAPLPEIAPWISCRETVRRWWLSWFD